MWGEARDQLTFPLTMAAFQVANFSTLNQKPGT